MELQLRINTYKATQYKDTEKHKIIHQLNAEISVIRYIHCRDLKKTNL